MTFSWKSTPAAIRTGLIAAVLGFVVSCTSTSSRRVNGRLTECSYIDGGALLAGIVAIVAGIVGLAAARHRGDDRSLMLGLSIAIIAVGVLHVLRGVGTVGGACN